MINDLVMAAGWNPGVLARCFFHHIQEWVWVERVPRPPPTSPFFPQLVCKFFEGRNPVFTLVLTPSLIVVRRP